MTGAGDSTTAACEDLVCNLTSWFWRGLDLAAHSRRLIRLLGCLEDAYNIAISSPKALSASNNHHVFKHDASERANTLVGLRC